MNDLEGCFEEGFDPQNIYITSDEEIKEGDWYLDTTINTLFKSDKIFLNGFGYKKIILTTDPRLAPDVQKIDDEFLEWFVKNPSCEYVEVKKEKIRVDKEFNDISHWNRFVHKIIIPEEETLSEKLEKIVSKEPSKFVEESNERFRIREEKKLKEAFDEIYNSIDFTEFDFASFKLGVKWEQERNK
jgi:hypothetical protein